MPAARDTVSNPLSVVYASMLASWEMAKLSESFIGMENSKRRDSGCPSGRRRSSSKATVVAPVGGPPCVRPPTSAITTNVRSSPAPAASTMYWPGNGCTIATCGPANTFLT